MKTIKVAAPAKINLTLEVLNKREDGFHNIKSIMQAISLYDYLTFTVEESDKNVIILSGNSDKIPYNEKNLVYKALNAFFEESGIVGQKVSCYIEKNIPVEAGLAGGSTDGAAALFAMNKLFGYVLSEETVDKICASLGSDLNFCLQGGRAYCTGRGENIKKISFDKCDVCLIKPLGFGISAKEAYTKFASLSDKSVPNNTEKMIDKFDSALLYNSLENAVIDDYKELREIKVNVVGSMMSGSGPTFFALKKNVGYAFDSDRFLTIENLEFIEDGVKEI